jgi:hypothetical protein
MRCARELRANSLERNLLETADTGGVTPVCSALQLSIAPVTKELGDDQ